LGPERTRSRRRDHRAPASLELVIAVGKAALLLAVDEVESDGIDASLREPGRELDHERTRLVAASTMREHRCNTHALASWRRIDERGYVVARRDLDADSRRHGSLTVWKLSATLRRFLWRARWRRAHRHLLWRAWHHPEDDRARRHPASGAALDRSP